MVKECVDIKRGKQALPQSQMECPKMIVVVTASSHSIVLIGEGEEKQRLSPIIKTIKKLKGLVLSCLVLFCVVIVVIIW